VCNGTGLAGCDGIPNSKTKYDFCGVCGGDNTTCMCLQYLGYDLYEVDYALLRWTLLASVMKINQTIDILNSINLYLPNLDYNSDFSLVEYIDTLHTFCDNCLDYYDFAITWYADQVAGNCEDGGCEALTASKFEAIWEPNVLPPSADWSTEKKLQGLFV